MKTIASHTLLLPAASVAVNLYNLVSVLPHWLLVLTRTLVIVGLAVQLSVAVAVPLHVVMAAFSVALAHSTVKFAGQVITGT